jgi:hypothetical protein
MAASRLTSVAWTRHAYTPIPCVGKGRPTGGAEGNTPTRPHHKAPFVGMIVRTMGKYSCELAQKGPEAEGKAKGKEKTESEARAMGHGSRARAQDKGGGQLR